MLGATSFAQGWDHFASAYSARAAGSVSPHAASPSLALWVVSSAEGLSEGQRPFERVMQLRAIEKERGFAFTFQKLPPVAQDYLERARLGAEHWVAQHSQKWPASPLVQSLAGRSLHPPPAHCGSSQPCLPHPQSHPAPLIFSGAAEHQLGLRVATARHLQHLGHSWGQGLRDGPREEGGRGRLAAQLAHVRRQGAKGGRFGAALALSLALTVTVTPTLYPNPIPLPH